MIGKTLRNHQNPGSPPQPTTGADNPGIAADAPRSGNSVHPPGIRTDRSHPFAGTAGAGPDSSVYAPG
jgi:hypothetical protein